jgi:hypothetical protein
MAHSVDETNEPPLISFQFGMAGGDLPAKEGHRPCALVEDNIETGPRCVALDDERLVNVRELEHRRRRARALEGVKHVLGFWPPCEPSFA